MGQAHGTAVQVSQDISQFQGGSEPVALRTTSQSQLQL
jgi:hypothetical protein